MALKQLLVVGLGLLATLSSAITAPGSSHFSNVPVTPSPNNSTMILATRSAGNLTRISFYTATSNSAVTPHAININNATTMSPTTNAYVNEPVPFYRNTSISTTVVNAVNTSNITAVSAMASDRNVTTVLSYPSTRKISVGPHAISTSNTAVIPATTNAHNFTTSSVTSSPSAFNTSNITVLPRLDSNSVHRLLFQTTYSSAAEGIKLVFGTCHAFKWCANDEKDWCPDAINSTLTSITDEVITASPDLDHQNINNITLLSTMASFSAKSERLAISWAQSLVNDSPLSCDPDRLEDLRKYQWYLSR